MLAEILSLSLTPVGGYYAVAAVTAVLLALLWLGPDRDRVPAGRRRALAMLRLLVIVLVALALLRPTVVWTETSRQSATLVVMVDRSRSMQVQDAAGKKSRWEALLATLADAKSALADLGQNLEVKFYAFDVTAQPIESTGGEPALKGPPEGPQTALGDALNVVLEREAGKRLAGVVLMSDGAQRAYAPHELPPHVPARRLADLGYKLYAVPFGQALGAGEGRDIALETLQTNGPVFVKNQLDVAGTVRIEGFVNQKTPVQLLIETGPNKMQVVGTAVLQANADGVRLPVALDYVPEISGEIKVTLRAKPQPGELLTTNNELSTFVTVLKGGLNVLYLNGAAQPEQKFLRRALDASPDIKVDYLFVRADKPETKPPDLAERFQPGKYDVYLIGDLDSTAFTKEELTQLATAVERGAGFIMLGGLYSFGAGGYGQTPLGDVLPIQMTRLDRQNLGENIRQDLHLAGRPKMKPSKLGATQSLMQLAAPERNDAAWAALPPLEGANRLGKLKPGANTLAETAAGDPLLVARDFGAGRVVAFAADSTWHWWLEGHEAQHKRFWRQMVLWLARKDESTEGNVWIKLDQRRYAPGSLVEFATGAETPQGESVPDALFTAEVIDPGGKRAPVRLRRQGTEMLGSLRETQAAGDYTLVVTATHSGVALGTARSRFLVFDQDLELTNPAADVGAMESLAAMTGGKRVLPEQLSSLLEQLKAETKELEIEIQAKRTLWDNWTFFLVFVALLTLEWFLRKRWGLV